MDELALMQAIEAVPPGRWGIGVSGGADSVALLLLMHRRCDVQLHVVHLDHQTREGESAVDAAFVADLAAKLGVPCIVQQRSVVESALKTTVKNTASRFRRARFELFSQVVNANELQGMLLAHHQDDQVETILMRLLRGAKAENLAGMQYKSNIQGLQILRPLLAIPSAKLRQFLDLQGQSWREDASNLSDQYQRNRVRHWLENRTNLQGPLLELGSSSANLNLWLSSAAPRLSESFQMTELNQLPLPLAKKSVACWLADRGAPMDLITEKVCIGLLEMASDAASSPRRNFPGGLLVRRRQGVISVET